jgi:Nodulation protein Z (NodZ)
MADGKFVLVKGRAGLGNRMLSALTGILYARLAGRRLLVDWSDRDYSHDGSNVFHRLFRCPIAVPSDEIPLTESVCPAAWRGHLHESPRQMEARYTSHPMSDSWRQFSIDLTRIDYQEDVLVMWAYNAEIDALRGHFRGEFEELRSASDDAILTRLLREDLEPVPEIRERVERFRARHFVEPTVGVHVRYSDHRANLLGILRRLDVLVGRQRGRSIFLATDNIEIGKMFESSYPGVVSTPHWYPEPGLKAHNNRECDDRLQSGIDATVDMYLLAECDYLIIDTSSSFSKLAGLLSRAPETHVFNARRRGKRGRRARELTWRLWLKLGLYGWGPRMLRMAAVAGRRRGEPQGRQLDRY